MDAGGARRYPGLQPSGHWYLGSEYDPSHRERRMFLSGHITLLSHDLSRGPQFP